MSRGAETPKDRVYEQGGLYRIVLRGGDLRKRHGKHTTVFRAPYVPVLTEKPVDILVVSDLPPQATKGSPFEVMVNPRSAGVEVLDELLLLVWHLDPQGGRLAEKRVTQPLGVWIYEGGAAVAACLKGGRERATEDWLRQARLSGDEGLAERLVLMARQPEVAPVDRGRSAVPWSTGRGGGPRSPVTTLYPFGSAGRAKRAGSAEIREPAHPEGASVGRAPAEPAVHSTSPLQAACERMDFGELRKFIDETLEGHRSGRSDEEGPRSKEELEDLLELLREKTDEWVLPTILRDPGAPPLFPWFTPSERLDSLHTERERLEEALAEVQNDPEATKRSIRKARRRIKLLKDEVDALEESEKADHERRREANLHSYREAQAAQERSLRERDAEVKRLPKRRLVRERIVTRVAKDIERAFSRSGGVVPTVRLPWRPLPPGELSADTLRWHYDSLQRSNPHIRYDPERIQKAFSLRPNRCYVGTDEFEGYVVFTFAHTEKALLECPIFGNAIYVLDADWRHLAKMSKRDLLADRPGEVTKIVHKGDWFGRVKRELGAR